MGKPTVHDIAREAGVSLATVDRVLNARPGVRAATVERVQEAVRRLGYSRDLSAANLARRRTYRFVFLLPSGPGQFTGTLKAALLEAAEAQQAERVSVRVLDVDTNNPHAVAQALNRLDPRRVDGVALMAPETPQLRDAVARLKAQGMAVVSLVSDLPNSDRDHFVGINNFAAGRTAGTLMGRFIGARRAKILIVTASILARDSLERRLGFDSVMAESFPGLEVLPSLESHGDPQRMQAVVCAALRAHPDIAGVYSLGSGNAPLLDALEDAGEPEAYTVIAHELTPVTRAGLQTGAIDAVITQNVGHLVRSALRVLRAKSDGVEIFEAQERIRIEIVIRDNLV